MGKTRISQIFDCLFLGTRSRRNKGEYIGYRKKGIQVRFPDFLACMWAFFHDFLLPSFCPTTGIFFSVTDGEIMSGASFYDVWINKKSDTSHTYMDKGIGMSREFETCSINCSILTCIFL